MRSWRFSWLVLILLLVVSSRPAFAEETARLFVELVDARAGAEQRSWRQLGERSPRRYTARGQERTARDMRRWRVIEVQKSQLSRLKVELVGRPGVASVHEEKLYHEARVPGDPLFVEQYALSGMAGVWEKATGSSATVIAVLDGGVDLEHEDLREKIWINSGEVPANNEDDDGNGFVDDVHGWDFITGGPAAESVHHATHVAGIAAAASDNGIGVAGVDWGARLMSVRVLGRSGVGREEGMIRAIDYAVANGADIINMSIEGPTSPVLLDAIENAYAAGVVVVAAAGNSGADTARVEPFPACADVGGVNTVIGVGATDEEGETASFSNYGPCVDVSAPGKNILSTKAGSRYGTMSGTSMSSPFVAGVAGLYLSLHPNAPVNEVIEAIVSSRTSSGLVDAATAVSAAPKVPINSPEPTPLPPASDGDGGGGGGGGGGASSEEPPPIPTSSAGRPRVAGVATHPKANLALLERIKFTFSHVFGRVPTRAEKTYWGDRVKRGDKRTYPALLGAMKWQRLHKNL